MHINNTCFVNNINRLVQEIIKSSLTQTLDLQDTKRIKTLNNLTSELENPQNFNSQKLNSLYQTIDTIYCVPPNTLPSQLSKKKLIEVKEQMINLTQLYESN